MDVSSPSTKYGKWIQFSICICSVCRAGGSWREKTVPESAGPRLEVPEVLPGGQEVKQSTGRLRGGLKHAASLITPTLLRMHSVETCGALRWKNIPACISHQ